ncbi:cytochrome c oxidase subunit 4 [Streptomyces sp. S.PNR 29]|uniref:aa3-type cytochrome oxidase subunit IV n=1 Tax=Streptomyces sp. S.PNR 29 TaxID=2973805 RepID=UPI0025B1797E|nr:cytochrome c oxidase subunit 4 [Streptomyces sp. S.PNR 29]MDN0199120.1 cytochrome c oxidase subunit 4 [Streptomyces sp. S.PNR 29]
MRTESRLFAGVAFFFAVTALGYGWRSEEPAGTAVLAVACLMAALVGFFLQMQHRRRGLRPQDRTDAEVVDSAGPLDFFPPRSTWPITIALGSVLLALGVVYGLWLALLGLGVLAHGVFGMVFQYAGRDGQGSDSPSDDSRSPTR